jgi:hypothetical protein
MSKGTILGACRVQRSGRAGVEINDKIPFGFVSQFPATVFFFFNQKSRVSLSVHLSCLG